jgi:outer membrane autotransporter protein
MKKTSITLLNICLGVSALFYPTDKVSAVITGAQTYNERHTQDALNSPLLAPTAIGIENAIISAQSADQQRDTLNDISGEQYANIIQSNQIASQQFMRRMYEPVRYDSLGLRCGQNCDEWNVWGAVGGGQAELKNSKSAKGYKLNDWNVAFGAQKPINFCMFDSWLTVGVAGYYERDDIKFRQNGRGHGDNWQGGLYYMWNNDRFYSFAATIIGTDKVHVKRHINSLELTARGRARTTQWTSYSEIGYNLCYNCIYVQPFAGIEYAWYRRHGLTEHGASPLNLHVRGKEFSSTIGRFGVHLTANLPYWDGILVSGDLAWRTRFNFLTERFQASFRHFSHPRFRIHGAHVKPNGFEGSLTLAKCFCDYYQGYVQIEGQAWDRYSTWDLSAGVNATF